jgi:uncharacterized protein YcaQ
MLEITKKKARRLIIGAQLLAGPPPKRPTRRMMRATIEQLGALQIDSISVVERSHHLVLWSRLGNHPTEWLHELMTDERAIFEYWAHACAYVPIELFGPFRRRMLEFPNNSSKRTVEWIEEHREVLEHVEQYVRENGAVSSRSFDPPEGAKRSEPWAWYGNKPTNLALDMLWTMGTLMIDRREGFQRIYDLTERVHPEWSDDDLPTEDEARDVLAERALQAMGLMTARWLPDYFRSGWSRAIASSLSRTMMDRLVERGVAVPARVRGLDDDVVVSAELLERRILPSRTTLLSPFDSLIWDRRRARELFDYEVKFEVYVPRPKRRYGYYNLAILHRDELVGQLDPKVDRKARELIIHSLHLEPDFAGRDDERFYADLAAALHDFRAFNGADDITIAWSDPPEAAGRLRSALTP